MSEFKDFSFWLKPIDPKQSDDVLEDECPEFLHVSESQEGRISFAKSGNPDPNREIDSGEPTAQMMQAETTAAAIERLRVRFLDEGLKLVQIDV